MNYDIENEQFRARESKWNWVQYSFACVGTVSFVNFMKYPIFQYYGAGAFYFVDYRPFYLEIIICLLMQCSNWHVFKDIIINLIYFQSYIYRILNNI